MYDYNSNPTNAGSEFVPAPELPLEAQLPPQLELDACLWLDQYVEFSQKWSPRSFDGYHEAVALWILSMVAARRTQIQFGKGLYTNLYILLIGRTGLYTKSTAANIGKTLIGKIGLFFLLLPEELTPQKMIQLMSNLLPEKFNKSPIEQKQKMLQTYAFVGQRGWFYDEFGANLENMMKQNGPYGDFHGLLRRLHDTDESYAKGTIARGSEDISMPYLSLLGALTPSDMASVAARNSKFWGSGYLARMAMVSPPPGFVKDERLPNELMEIDESLLQPIRNWHSRLGIPKVIEMDGKAAQDTSKSVSKISLSTETWDAYYRYDGAVRKILQDINITDLDSNYVRFPEKALRIAALFASLGGFTEIKLNHWAKAQAITERWRSNLHSLYKQVNSQSTAAAKKLTSVQKVLSVIYTKNYPTSRDIQLATGLDSKEVAKELDILVLAEKVISEKAGKTTRYRINRPQPADTQQSDASDLTLDDCTDVEETVLPPPEDIAGDNEPSASPCHACGRSEFRQRPDGGWVCTVCHPGAVTQVSAIKEETYAEN